MSAHAEFGPFTLLERIAEGGMAVTWLARAQQAPPSEEVVIKRILPRLLDDTELRTLFRDEAELALRLSHPNLVRTFARARHEEEDYLVMEYVWGEDLRRIAERGGAIGKPLALRAAVRIIAEAARGLHHFHQMQDEEGRPLEPVHRDVSPPNLMVTYDGQVKVVDFGIAKAESRLLKARQGQLKGKFSYMSPEQVQGLAVDHRSDIFSLGTLLYELTTRRRLFRADGDVLTIKLVSEARVMAPHAARPDYPPQLEEIVLRALARDPRSRWQSAGELADALESFLDENRLAPTAAQLADYMREIFPDRLDRQQELLGADYAGPVAEPTLPDLEEKPAPEPEAIDNVTQLSRDTSSHAVAPSTETLAEIDDEDLRLRGRGTRRLIFAAMTLVALAAVGGAIWMGATRGFGPSFEASDPAARAADEAAEAPPQMRTLQLQAEPSQARFLVNGNLLPDAGTAEASLFAEGPNTLFVMATGYVPQKIQLPADFGDDRLQVTLDAVQPPPGWTPPESDEEEAEAADEDARPEWPQARIRVAATHGGQRVRDALVLVNGRPIENRTPADAVVPAGHPVHVTVREAGFRDSHAIFTPRETRGNRPPDEVLLDLSGDDQALALTTVRIQVTPPEATVYLDGERQTARSLLLRPPHAYHVRVEAPEHEPWEHVFAPGSPGVIHARIVLPAIPRPPALLDLRVEGENTRIFAEQAGRGPGARQIGTDAVSEHQVDAGTWIITLARQEEDRRLRERFELELEPWTHHRYMYALDEEGAHLLDLRRMPMQRDEEAGATP